MKKSLGILAVVVALLVAGTVVVVGTQQLAVDPPLRSLQLAVDPPL